MLLLPLLCRPFRFRFHHKLLPLLRRRFRFRRSFFRFQLFRFRFQLLMMFEIFRVFVEPIGQIFDRIPWTSISHLQV